MSITKEGFDVSQKNIDALATAKLSYRRKQIALQSLPTQPTLSTAWLPVLIRDQPINFNTSCCDFYFSLNNKTTFEKHLDYSFHRAMIT